MIPSPSYVSCRLQSAEHCCLTLVRFRGSPHFVALGDSEAGALDYLYRSYGMDEDGRLLSGGTLR